VLFSSKNDAAFPALSVIVTVSVGSTGTRQSHARPYWSVRAVSFATVANAKPRPQASSIASLAASR
jgi:hypothetical protein